MSGVFWGKWEVGIGKAGAELKGGGTVRRVRCIVDMGLEAGVVDCGLWAVG